jgi:hypothetical protein
MTFKCRCRNACDMDDDDYDEHEGIYLGIICICRCCVCFSVGALTLVALMISGLVDTALFPRDAVIAFGVVGFAVLLCVVVAVLCNNPENWPWAVCTSPEGVLYFFTGHCCCCIQCEWVDEPTRNDPPTSFAIVRTDSVTTTKQVTPADVKKETESNTKATSGDGEKTTVIRTKKKRTRSRRQRDKN